MAADRVVVTGFALTGLLVLFAGRAFQLQIIHGDRYATATEQARVINEILPPRRGRILDRSGTPIADTRPVYHASVVFEDLVLRGRLARDVVWWTLDERRFGTLLADLRGRLRLAAGTDLQDVVTRELLGHPATALRWGPRRGEGAIALVSVDRRAFDPQRPMAEDEDGPGIAALAEGDQLQEDPVTALEAEVRARWNLPVQILREDAWRAACAVLDRDFRLEDTPSADLLAPFSPAFVLALPGQPELRLRLLAEDQRTQALAAIATVADVSPNRLEARFHRALAEALAARPVAAGPRLYGPASQAEIIAPRLPRGTTLAELTINGVPGGRERILLIQGDPPQVDGVYGQLTRRLAASLGLDAVTLQSLIERHAEPMRSRACEQAWGIHPMPLDHERLNRLGDGLAAALTDFGRATTRLEVDQRLAKARLVADKGWVGRTRRDALRLFADIPGAFAVRFAGRDAEPPREFKKRYDDAVAELPGLTVSVDVGRAYPQGDTLCHTLGTLGPDPADPEGPSVGRWGLEATYDTILRGVAGSRLRIRTPEGLQVAREEKPLDGADLVTEIDLDSQKAAEDGLSNLLEIATTLGTATDRMERAQAVGRGRGGFVLIDCHTGGLLALASNPRYSYDQLGEDYQKLIKDPAEPLIDHACSPGQPPGSSFKILTALACLEYGVINPGAEIYCKGYMAMVGNQKVLRDHAPAGTYDLVTAIQMSSNVYFATIGATLGPQRLTDIAAKVGLGRRNALDVAQQPPDDPRHLPTPATIRRIRPREPTWYPSDTWRMSIGQFSAASPLQCVAIAAAVANGGHIVRPFLVKPLGDVTVTDLHIKKEWLDDVRLGMEKVTANEPHSTAKLLVLQGPAAGIKVAAKTGTAEWGSSATREAGKTPDHAWMIGYAPADNPTVAFACYIHSGTYGGQACTPVVKKVLEAYFAKYGRDGHR